MNPKNEYEKNMDILQSFVDLARESCIKEDLKNDIDATEWAINTIKSLEKERDFYKSKCSDFNEALVKGGGKLCR